MGTSERARGRLWEEGHGGAVLSAHTVSTRLTAHRKVIFYHVNYISIKSALKKIPEKKHKLYEKVIVQFEIKEKVCRFQGEGMNRFQT